MNMNFTRAAGLTIAAGSIGLLLPLTASAQQVGTYTGTSATGQTVTVTVGLDAGTGQYQLTEIDGGITENCAKGDNPQVGWGWGFQMGQDFSGTLVTNTLYTSTLYVKTTLKFVGTDTIKGQFVSSAPSFVVSSTVPPTQIQLCHSGKVPFTLSFIPGPLVSNQAAKRGALHVEMLPKAE